MSFIILKKINYCFIANIYVVFHQFSNLSDDNIASNHQGTNLKEQVFTNLSINILSIFPIFCFFSHLFNGYFAKYSVNFNWWKTVRVSCCISYQYNRIKRIKYSLV